MAPELEALGFECVKLEVVGSTGNPVVRLYIDKPGGVSIGDCSLVSRSIGLLLDKEDLIPGRYLLEVSSPGNDRPLVTEAHFRRFEGESAKVQVSDGTVKTTYTGVISSCADGMLTLETEEHVSVDIPMSKIIKASLVGRSYEIDKKMKRQKRKRKNGRSPRVDRERSVKGDK